MTPDQEKTRRVLAQAHVALEYHGTPGEIPVDVERELNMILGLPIPQISPFQEEVPSNAPFPCEDISGIEMQARPFTALKDRWIELEQRMSKFGKSDYFEGRIVVNPNVSYAVIRIDMENKRITYQRYSAGKNKLEQTTILTATFRTDDLHMMTRITLEDVTRQRECGIFPFSPLKEKEREAKVGLQILNLAHAILTI